jgi:uncharacterized protein YdhG (YjbR/CyaY superfamily)
LPVQLTGHQNGVVPAEEIDRYLDALAEPRRAALARRRRMIVDILPGAGQGISCGVPAFRAGGKTIAGFAAFENHLGYLPHSGSVFPQRRDELGGYPLWSGAVRFSIGEPRPAPLAGKLVAVRLAQAFPG